MFILTCFLSLLIPLRLGFLISEINVTLSHVCFPILLCKPPICSTQRASSKYAFRDPSRCFYSSFFVLFLSDSELLNETVCSYVENQQHNEASLAGLFRFNSGHVLFHVASKRQNTSLQNDEVNMKCTKKRVKLTHTTEALMYCIIHLHMWEIITAFYCTISYHDIKAINLQAAHLNLMNYFPAFNVLTCKVSPAVMLIEVTFFKAAPHAAMRYSGRERR